VISPKESIENSEHDSAMHMHCNTPENEKAGAKIRANKAVDGKGRDKQLRTLHGVNTATNLFGHFLRGSYPSKCLSALVRSATRERKCVFR
jgi:hypothetical protein